MASLQVNEAVQREILGEQTSALARATRALEVALAELAAAREAGREAAREDALAEAGERLWYVVVQREAMGLLRHESLLEVLRVPRAVRLAMGPRRRR